VVVPSFLWISVPIVFHIVQRVRSLPILPTLDGLALSFPPIHNKHKPMTFQPSHRRVAKTAPGVIVVVPTAMNTPANSSDVPCEYDAQRGGFPLAVLEQPQPAEFCCVTCQRIARYAVTVCKGSYLSDRIRTKPHCSYTHTHTHTSPTARQ